MTTAELIAKARDAGVVTPDKEAVEISITVPGYKPVRVTAIVDKAALDLDGTPRAAVHGALTSNAVLAVSDRELWDAARITPSR